MDLSLQSAEAEEYRRSVQDGKRKAVNMIDLMNDESASYYDQLVTALGPKLSDLGTYEYLIWTYQRVY